LNDRLSLDWCPWCGEKLPDYFAVTRLMHDRMCHPGYMLAQMGIDECEHENKTCQVEVIFDKSLPIFHLAFCKECYHKYTQYEISIDKKTNTSKNLEEPFHD
jgi:hypothetical protein